MTRCDLCYEAPASVFTSTLALCKPCKRDADLLESLDTPIPNEPTCPNCGTIHFGHACHRGGVLIVGAA